MNESSPLSAVPLAELLEVDGGSWSGVDIRGMPSRDVICGTIWIATHPFPSTSLSRYSFAF